MTLLEGSNPSLRPYCRLVAIGKKTPVVVAAIAREMEAFLWAIGHHVEPVS